MRGLGVWLIALATIGAAQNTREMTAEERGLLVLDPVAEGGYSNRGGMIGVSYLPRIRNETRLEVASIEFGYRIKRGTHVTYQAKPVIVKQFENMSYPHVGALLPYNWCRCTKAISFEFPSEKWTTLDQIQLYIRSAKAWTGKGDLHDPAHLFTTIANTHTPELIARFNQDPSLLQVRNSVGFTPILMAFGAADVALLKYLQSKGAKPTGKTVNGENAMFIAALSDDPRNLDYALSLGIKVDSIESRFRRTPLFYAIKEKRVNSIKWLVAHKANVNHVDNGEDRPLDMVIKYGGPPTFAPLMAGKPNVHYFNKAGRGPMVTAVVKGYDMLDLLNKAGVGVNECDPKVRFTPIMAAAVSQSHIAAAWLLDHGANLNARDKSGKTAQDYSRESNTLGTDQFWLRFLDEYRRTRGR